MPTEDGDSRTNNLDARLATLEPRLAGFLDRQEAKRRWKDTWIPLLSLLVALAGIGTGTFVQFVSLRTQSTLKQYEVTFLAKQKGYAEVLASLDHLFVTSRDDSHDNLVQTLMKVESTAYAIMPFLPEAKRYQLRDDVLQANEICLNVFKKRQLPAAAIDSEIDLFITLKSRVEDRLARDLFIDDVRS